MGVNRVGFCITDDEACREAAKQEIIRRYFISLCEYKKGHADEDMTERNHLIMDELNLTTKDRVVVGYAREAAKKAAQKNNHTRATGAAIMLKDGTFITGKGSELMNAPSGLLLNAIKHIAGIPDELHIIKPEALHPITKLKRKILHSRKTTLDMEEVLIALSMSAVDGSNAELALSKLEDLNGCEAHTSNIISSSDEEIFRRLGINLTSDAQFESEDLFYL
jgi:uncharacterized protein (UPF0371 family)